MTLVEYAIALTVAVGVGTAALSLLSTEVSNEVGGATTVLQATP
ncbi:MAG: hypothetical protein R3D63_01085 [Paracoccaceae bacterium]